MTVTPLALVDHDMAGHVATPIALDAEAERPATGGGLSADPVSPLRR